MERMDGILGLDFFRSYRTGELDSRTFRPILRKQLLRVWRRAFGRRAATVPGDTRRRYIVPLEVRGGCPLVMLAVPNPLAGWATTRVRSSSPTPVRSSTPRG